MGFADGMTIDSHGMIWVAMWEGYSVLRFNPKTAELLGKVNVPVKKTTSCVFKDENTLFISTAGGCIYSLEL